MYPTLKRILDLLTAVVGLVLLAPLFALVVLLLIVAGGGDIFYLQARVGYKNRIFNIWKFSTMLKNSPNMGNGSLTVRNDPRVTPVGSWLRKSKVNELPQLFNLLLGNMTLVGPRPQMRIDFEAFPPGVQAQIYNVKPGITGIGSIVFRDEERLLSVPGRDPRQFYVAKIAPYKGALEIWYQQHISFWTDLLLLLLTAWVLLKPNSQAPFRIFKDLPALPDDLKMSGADGHTFNTSKQPS